MTASVIALAEVRQRRRATRRHHRPLFDMSALRRREIERHAKHYGSGELRNWLIAWCWHNTGNRRDPAGALQMAAERMGREIGWREAERLLAAAAGMRQCRSADRLARFLGVTCEQRRRLGITTIGAIDCSAEERAAQRKQRQREREHRRRAAKGAKPRAEYEARSLSCTKPWEAEGISRRTWYRRRSKT